MPSKKTAARVAVHSPSWPKASVRSTHMLARMTSMETLTMMMQGATEKRMGFSLRGCQEGPQGPQEVVFGQGKRIASS